MSASTRARAAHEALVRALATLETAHQNAVLAFAEVLHHEHYRALNYSSIHHYAQEELKFSASKTMQFVRLAKSVKRLPALEKALEDGELTWTQARVVGSVATEQNQREWVDRAKSSTRRELELDVKRAKARPRARAKAQPTLVAAPQVPAGDPPRRVGFDLTGLQAAQLEKLMEQARRQGHRDAAEMLLSAMQLLVSQASTRVHPRAAAQVVAYRCDGCQSVAVPSANGMRALSVAEGEALACDADHLATDGSKRSGVTPKLRRAVLARDRHRCRRCSRTAFVDVHHLRRKADDGTHKVENLVTLCRACHVNWHQEEERLLARGSTSERILQLASQFAAPTPPPRSRART